MAAVPPPPPSRPAVSCFERPRATPFRTPCCPKTSPIPPSCRRERPASTVNSRGCRRMETMVSPRGYGSTIAGRLFLLRNFGRGRPRGGDTCILVSCWALVFSVSSVVVSSDRMRPTRHRSPPLRLPHQPQTTTADCRKAPLRPRSERRRTTSSRTSSGSSSRPRRPPAATERWTTPSPPSAPASSA